MTRESALWTRLFGALPAAVHAVRVENMVEVGTPDVNLCFMTSRVLSRSQVIDALVFGAGVGAVTGRVVRGEGCYRIIREMWVELKVVEKPARVTTKVRVEHFTMEQRQWLVNRARAGGEGYLLLQVGDQYLWLRGDVAAVFVGTCTLEELRNHALWHGQHLTKLVDWILAQ